MNATQKLNECLSKNRHSGSDALDLRSETLSLKDRSAEFRSYRSFRVVSNSRFLKKC
ncbi:hypothetical protein LEP1GSC032_1798 [Leptospira interrogans str. 2002000631]|uniref:Uncharacterized protein n=3 Tax=Leptospira interrogans TaxID=173 RepID=A0AAQ1NW19_LEPIR|nr:hypothetical protein LEP1GSC025_0854 [Leptospira interrogans str. 2002000621]EKQ47692.1 hypothetical protein LEP1GSC026_4454 [Leptospira interrogans str. 2002000623]EMJ74466.1 hypothetical protein LEP1GSC033_1818 [Leptospira interrogans str. 2002000632]EMJ79708.1 hypothetical protein LEP1GSC032_1798 [Leptospira interrogans str. 2002000631]EMY04798.1 hypothetical protein LEP1GSC029_2018 [Leptospira interrogans str. 2002000626]EMY23220.1 hypothetical protein LEP1GSC115_5039 [Leptospira interr